MQVPLQITAGELPLVPELEAYIRERADKLEEFYDGIVSCRVTIPYPPSHSRKGEPYEIDIHVHVPGKHLVVNKQSHPDLQIAITQAFEAMERQVDEFGRKQRGQVKQDQKPPHARIVRLFPESGYGFLKDVEGTERYFHRNSVLPPTTFEELAVGAEVRYTPEQGDEGPQASSVALTGK